MKIIFVRHGQTDWNKKKVMQGLADIPLNKSGIEQAQIVAEKLKNIPIDIAFCSPLTRAKQTLNIINDNRTYKIPTLFEEALKERDYKEFEGKNKSDFNYAGYWDYTNPDFLSNIYSFIFPILKFIIETLMKKYEDKTVLVVAHGGVAKVFEMLLGNESLYPEEMAEYLPKNIEILEYTSVTDSYGLVFESENPSKESRKVQNQFFAIITPNMVYGNKKAVGGKLLDNIIDDGISKIPKVRYRAGFIFQDAEGKIALLHYSKTGEYKLPGGSYNPYQDNFSQLQNGLLDVTGFRVSKIDDLELFGKTIEIRPSDPIGDVTYSHIYVVRHAEKVSEPDPCDKERAEGYNLDFCSLSDATEKITNAFDSVTSIGGKYRRPLITKYSINLRDQIIVRTWGKVISSNLS
jgi:broad specificity phosphatase PhoE